MKQPKFAIGDRVRVVLDHSIEVSPDDVHTVSRKLPALANVWQYRVKRVGDGQERAVDEDHLVMLDRPIL